MAITKDDIIKALEEMKLTELNELVKAIEEHFDVVASAGVAVAAAGPAASAAPTEVSLVLVSSGAAKVQVIKEVKEILGLGLMDAKKLVDSNEDENNAVEKDATVSAENKKRIKAESKANKYFIIEDVSKAFKNGAGVKDITFEIKKGEIVGFIGDNGSGKTTTIKLIFGEHLKDAGHVSLQGIDSTNKTSFK
ncbi:hypothetical protein FQA39_LY12997 [Lamprigera yunnana]|nr:hypothetical protein FQA39_LY12997 [Lamprigera yunnana]